MTRAQAEAAAVLPPAAASLTRRRIVLVASMGVALVFAAVASIAIGANPLSISQVWQGFVHPDETEASLIVWTLRGPRTLLGLLAGASFGVAGALIQGLTRNPLADPGILGVNAGAGFTVTLAAGILALTQVGGYIWFAFIGAAAATVAVTLIGSVGKGGLNPVTLVLAGVALSAVLGGISTFLTLIDEQTFRSVQNWGLGSLTRGTVVDTLTVAPFIGVGLLLALVLSQPLNSIALGDDLAASLGVNVTATRFFGVVAVTLLAGGATALTGGLAFVGLMVPHIIRWCTGPDQRWIITGSLIGGPILVLAADVLGRVIAYPGEIEVGILTALIGAPMLISLVRRQKASGL